MGAKQPHSAPPSPGRLGVKGEGCTQFFSLQSPGDHGPAASRQALGRAGPDLKLLSASFHQAARQPSTGN